MLDPRVAHHIDGRHLRLAVPQLNPQDLHSLRSAFANYLQTHGARNAHQSWQEAWNDWTGATSHKNGLVQIRTARCPNCSGRIVTHRNAARNLSRTGNPAICGECRGTGKGQQVTLVARFVPAPNPEGHHGE